MKEPLQGLETLANLKQRLIGTQTLSLGAKPAVLPESDDTVQYHTVKSQPREPRIDAPADHSAKEK